MSYLTASRVYRASIHLLIILGIFALIFLAFGIVIGVNNGNWTVTVVIVLVFAVLHLLLQVLRLEISATGFRYRNLRGSHEIMFKNVARAYIEVIRAKNVPQGAAVFWVEPQNGRKLKINLRTFPIQAAADLFTALELHGIKVDVPDAWAARRMAEQVRAAQARPHK
jgi:hypothetical protein